MGIDYKDLLWKYMCHVVDMEEALTVLEYEKQHFTAEELEALQEIAERPHPDDVVMGDA